MENKFYAAIEQSNTIALFTHVRPDGDALGSTLALAEALETFWHKTVFMFCETPIPERFRYLKGSERIQTQGKPQADLFLSLDCGDLTRLGIFAQDFMRHKNSGNIDHHASNTRFAKWNCVKPYASCSEIVFELLQNKGVPLSLTMATALFTGLSTDTGNFSHSNTDTHAFLTAAALTEAKAPVKEINDRLYKSVPFRKWKLLSRVLGNLRSYDDGKIVLIYTLKQDLEATGNLLTDTESFVDYAVEVDTAEVGIALCEQGPNVYKVSMRSKGKVDVCSACSVFGGGGHKMASGCLVSGFFEDVVDKVLKSVRDEL